LLFYKSVITLVIFYVIGPKVAQWLRLTKCLNRDNGTSTLVRTYLLPTDTTPRDTDKMWSLSLARITAGSSVFDHDL
jgi:hypothetical protein